jgi:hypothetical protein
MALFFWGFGMVGYLFALEDRMSENTVEILLPPADSPFVISQLVAKVCAA